MTIRGLTRELYQAQQQVHRLQDSLTKAPVGDRERLRRKLQEAEAACHQLRRLLEGRKETGAGTVFSVRPRRRS